MTKSPLTRKMTIVGAAMHQGAFPPEMNQPDPFINVLIFFKKAPSCDAIAAAFEKHLWPCYRFNSCMENSMWVRHQETMDRAFHIREQAVANEAAIDEYVHSKFLEKMETGHPSWYVTVLKAPSVCRSAVFFRVHHSIGDGLGLLFALSPMFQCEGGNALAHVPLPQGVLPPSVSKSSAVARGSRPSKPRGTDSGGCFQSFRLCLKGAFSALVLPQDSELSINPPISRRTPNLPFSGRRVYSRFPPLPLSAVAAVRKRHGCSLNDAVMAALTGALRRYAMEVHGDKRLEKAGPGTLECKSMVMIGLPRRVDPDDMTSALRNKMLFASIPLPIDEPTAEGRMRRTIEECVMMKSKSAICGLNAFTKCITGIAPQAVLNKAAGETFSKHTLLTTNVPATTCPLTWPKEGGEEIQEVYAIIPNVMSQVSLVSYNGAIYGNLVADPELFPDPAGLGKLLLAELDVLAA